MNCTKSFQKKLNFEESIDDDHDDDDDDDDDDDKNDNHTEEDPEQINHKLNRTVVSDSATGLIGLSPIKAVGKWDWVKYSKQKVTESKKSLVGLVASACDIHENELFLIHQGAPNALTWMD